MNRIALLLTVFNRCAKTLTCLDLIERAFREGLSYEIKVFLTDDGSTDHTTEEIQKRGYTFPLQVLQGSGQLYWNGGMINSWKAALHDPLPFDGYLWLNDDTEILPHFWEALAKGEAHCRQRYGTPAILVGSTTDLAGKHLTYGGFNFTNVFTLKDEFIQPDGTTYQECQAAHGNLTYIPHTVVEKMGIFTPEYIHGGSDHDYTYRAHKKGFKVVVLPDFVGRCDNDHDKEVGFHRATLKERLAFLHSPLGYNLHNALLFQKRCFPYRYPFVFLMGYAKAICPSLFTRLYQLLRK